MKILVHDYSGHPFQAQLSRELARRGHDVVHSTCVSYVSGKGNLAGDASDGVRFVTIGERTVLRKDAYVHRLFQETRLGLELARQLRRERPEVALLGNLPIPTLVVAAPRELAAQLHLEGVAAVVVDEDAHGGGHRGRHGVALSPARA